MTMREKELLKELSKEQLIYLIGKFKHSQFLISEACVSESKQHIESSVAVDKIRGYIYDMPHSCSPTELKTHIDMEMGSIPAEEYRKIIGLD